MRQATSYSLQTIYSVERDWWLAKRRIQQQICLRIGNIKTKLSAMSAQPDPSPSSPPDPTIPPYDPKTASPSPKPEPDPDPETSPSPGE
jgi:hypothetical protein